MSRTAAPADFASSAAFLDGGGELGALIRAFDWARTPLGPPEAWSRSLKTTVRIMLTSRQPIWIGWGHELTYLYNDPYKSIIGGKHPQALGRPFAEVWPETYHLIGPMADHVITRDEGTYVEAMLLIMERHGYQEETYYTFSYSPIPSDEGDRPGGLICANTDDTRRVIGERQIATLRELATRTANARNWREVCQLTVQALATNDRDVPFALAYVAERDGALQLAAASPGTASLHNAARWRCDEVMRSNGLRVVRLNAVAAIPTGGWPRPPAQAAVLPIAPSGGGRAGALVVGLNPFRQFDDSYRSFLQLVSSQTSAAIANAQAYEDEKQRAESLAQLDQAKTVFFSNVSHEFRTPLTLLLAPVDELLAKAGGEADDRALLEVARRNGQRLLKLVNTLLDFARIEAGRTQASYEPTDLAALTADLASNFRAACDRAGLELVVDCSPLPEAAHVDREMWEKIVLNLVSNAFKFTLEGRIAVRMRATDGQVRLTVSDTGSGIAPEELPRMFERFHRIEATRGRSHEGSGIGLALVQELVKLHGGTIGVQSTVGAGSTFTVSIPRGSAHLPAERIKAQRAAASTAARASAYVDEAMSWLPGAAASQREVAATHRVLVADDNADLREYARRLLAEHYDVEAVHDGEAALSAARARKPDLIVSDVMMPRLDGFGLIRELRADAELCTVPVVLLSARAGEEARVEGLGKGADDYLAKPFSARELLVRVGALLQSAELRKQALEQERRAAEQLRDKLDEMKTLLDALPVGVFIARDAACADIGMNAAGAAMLRLSEGDNASKTGPDAARLPFRVLRDGAEIAPEDLPMQRAARLGCPVIGEEVELQFADGSTASLHEHVVPLFDAGGRTRGCVGVFVDITERKHAERLLTEQKALLERIAAGRPLDECLTSLCSAVPRLSAGVRACVLLADEERRSFPRVITPDLAPTFGAGLAGAPINELLIGTCGEAVYRGKPVTCTDITADMKWSQPWRELCIAHGMLAAHLEPIIGLDGLPLGSFMLGFDRPRTPTDWEFRLAQFGAHAASIALERDRAIRALEEADRRKDEFIATLSHELRNPLAPLRNSLHVLGMAGIDAATATRVQQMMERQVAHLNRLVDDLLEMSRISRGNFELRNERVDAATVLRHAAETCQPLIEAAGHRLDLSMPDEPVWLDGDPVRLAQIVANLLNNAAKYTNDGGQISLRAERQGGSVAISVRDNGIGIAPEALQSMFEMFVRGGASASGRGQGGLGIGLALARRLAQMHGGRLDARSDGPGKGSEFTLRLPLVAQPAPDSAATESTAAALPRRRVLVVDDNRDAADSLALILEQSGAQVRTAHDGPQALAAFGEYNPAVVLLDIGMPGMDGYEVARRMRASFPQHKSTLVALTGWGQEEDRRRARDAGFDHHLTKPAELSALKELLASLNSDATLEPNAPRRGA